jgi:hypothetical protein
VDVDAVERDRVQRRRCGELRAVGEGAAGPEVLVPAVAQKPRPRPLGGSARRDALDAVVGGGRAREPHLRELAAVQRRVAVGVGEPRHRAAFADQHDLHVAACLALALLGGADPGDAAVAQERGLGARAAWIEGVDRSLDEEVGHGHLKSRGRRGPSSAGGRGWCAPDTAPLGARQNRRR